jgi:hypothetical protein
MINFIKNFFTEPDGTASSKRLVGILASLGLIIYMFIYPSEGANNSVLILAISGLGLSSIDKIVKPR